MQIIHSGNSRSIESNIFSGASTFTVNVDAPERTFDAIDLELPEWIIYIVIGGILMVGVVVFLFLKKSKGNSEEEWEEEEEI